MKHLWDLQRLVVTTLSHGPLERGSRCWPLIARFTWSWSWIVWELLMVRRVQYVEKALFGPEFRPRGTTIGDPKIGDPVSRFNHRRSDPSIQPSEIRTRGPTIGDLAPRLNHQETSLRGMTADRRATEEPLSVVWPPGSRSRRHGHRGAALDGPATGDPALDGPATREPLLTA